jgi:hypothetical protein
MKKLSKRNIVIGIIIVLIFSTAWLLFGQNTKKPTTPKCPESYPENEAGATEYKDALIAWTSEFFEKHPQASMSDWSMAKSQFWLDNNCTMAIERSKMSGEVSGLKPWELVDYEIQKALDEALKNNP